MCHVTLLAWLNPNIFISNKPQNCMCHVTLLAWLIQIALLIINLKIVCVM